MTTEAERHYKDRMTVNSVKRSDKINFGAVAGHFAAAPFCLYTEKTGEVSASSLKRNKILYIEQKN